MKEKKLSKKEYRYYKGIEVMLRKVYTHNIRYHVCYLAVWFHIYTHTHTQKYSLRYMYDSTKGNLNQSVLVLN